jgi:NADPH:quinone reductase-like Zn-dependent oxidoreductase
MKAALLKKEGNFPIYTDISVPLPKNDDQLVVNVRASSIKQLDLQKAAGTHYTHFTSLPVVVGMDGVAVMEDGQRIYAMGITGMMAEKALIQKEKWIKVPDGLDDTTAAALPNALVGSDIPLHIKGNIKSGDVVLINGATGATGMIAVQMAKFHKAATIIATGRNPAVLDKLKRLGADVIISLAQPDHAIIEAFKRTYMATPFDIVVDYLWGKSIELLVQALSALPSQKQTKIIAVSEMGGKSITLASDSLRSRDIIISGSGIGSFSPRVIAEYLQNVLPEVFDYAAHGGIEMDNEILPLKDIADAWKLNGSIVVKI